MAENIYSVFVAMETLAKRLETFVLQLNRTQ